MGLVIVKGADIQCQHGAAVTSVSTAVKAVLEVAGKNVLAGTLAGSTIASANCTQQPSQAEPSNVPCALISTQTKGPSSVLFVGSEAVLLEDAAGATTGSPKNDWSVKGTGQKLLTVQ